MSTTVNRHLSDPHFNRIDHALGRPVDPLAETYRSHYAIQEVDQRFTELASSPHWERGQTVNGLTFFYVTESGRKALAEHLLSIKDRNRLFVVTWRGMPAEYATTTGRKAKAAAWRDARDAFPSLKFGEFVREATVEVAP
ncbi:hypothetical protein [Martelella sp. HB161492]|uniref:hypothetical protein n=1 Tax=Martelella sp. HB161492 TaxID=2720726 RepID=UPI001590BFD2|nr:hypothetical protein [Martelella sp. HB161492]